MRYVVWYGILFSLPFFLFCPFIERTHTHARLVVNVWKTEIGKNKSSAVCVCTVLWVHSMHSFIRMWISEHVCVWHYGMHIKLKFLRLNSRSIKNKRNDFNNNAHNSSYPLNEHMCTLVLCWQCLILLLLWTWFFFHTVQFEFKKCVSHSNSYTTHMNTKFECVFFLFSFALFLELRRGEETKNG